VGVFLLDARACLPLRSAPCRYAMCNVEEQIALVADEPRFASMIHPPMIADHAALSLCSAYQLWKSNGIATSAEEGCCHILRGTQLEQIFPRRRARPIPTCRCDPGAAHDHRGLLLRRQEAHR